MTLPHLAFVSPFRMLAEPIGWFPLLRTYMRQQMYVELRRTLASKEPSIALE